jgi:hypothetical protein
MNRHGHGSFPFSETVILPKDFGAAIRESITLACEEVKFIQGIAEKNYVIIFKCSCKNTSSALDTFLSVSYFFKEIKFIRLDYIHTESLNQTTYHQYGSI